MRKVHNLPDMGLGINTYYKYDITTNINESVHLIVNDPSSVGLCSAYTNLSGINMLTEHTLLSKITRKLGLCLKEKLHVRIVIWLMKRKIL